jgi:YbaB/EbfC DNA-binding family protein
VADELEALTETAAKLHAARVEAAKKVKDFGGLREQLGQIRAIVHSPDGSVAVAAGPGGTVQDIRFAPQALALGPDGLRAAVMGTLRQAIAQAARQQAQLVQQYVGDDMDVVGQTRAAQAPAAQAQAAQAQAVQQGPVIPPPAPPTPPAAAPQRPPRPTRPRPAEEEPAEYQVNMIRRGKGRR